MPAIQSPTVPLIGQASNVVLLSFFLTACVSAYVVYQRFFHPLASVPGPFWASLSRLWITKHSWDGDMHRTMIALHEKHGPIVRNGPNEVSIADLSAIKTIYGAGTKFRKSDWYSVWQGHRKFDLFAEKDEKLHGKQRSLISSAYSMTSLKDLEPYVDDSVKRFLDAMSERQNQVVDMGKWAQLFAFGRQNIHLRYTYLTNRLQRRYWRDYLFEELRLHGCSSRRWFLRTDRGRSTVCRMDRTSPMALLAS